MSKKEKEKEKEKEEEEEIEMTPLESALPQPAAAPSATSVESAIVESTPESSPNSNPAPASAKPAPALETPEQRLEKAKAQYIAVCVMLSLHAGEDQSKYRSDKDRFKKVMDDAMQNIGMSSENQSSFMVNIDDQRFDIEGKMSKDDRDKIKSQTTEEFAASEEFKQLMKKAAASPAPAPAAAQPQPQPAPAVPKNPTFLLSAAASNRIKAYKDQIVSGGKLSEEFKKIISPEGDKTLTMSDAELQSKVAGMSPEDFFE